MSFRQMLRLLFATAVLLLAGQSVGERPAGRGDAFAASHHRSALPSLAGDPAAGRERPVSSLEEHFAFDDDPEPDTKALSFVAPSIDSGLDTATTVRPPRRGRPLPSHRACAAPPTGPPAV